jgi:hypothetical protein
VNNDLSEFRFQIQSVVRVIFRVVGITLYLSDIRKLAIVISLKHILKVQ